MKNFMHLVFIFTIHLISPTRTNDITEWSDYVETFKDFYEDLDIFNEVRYELFMKSLRRVKEWNEEYEKGLRSYKIGINVLSARTDEEISKMLNYDAFNEAFVDNSTKLGRLYNDDDEDDDDIPDSLDWREEGIVSPIKYQGNCAACYAFSVCDTIESQYAMETGELVELSVQMLVDCTIDRNEGCTSGYMGKTFDFVKENGGLATAEDYPFVAKVRKCKRHLTNPKYTLKKYYRLPRGDELLLKKAVAKVGPIAAAIDANPKAFEEYKEGIFDHPDCSSKVLFHTVVIVGYGTDDNGKDYWILKNSWSEHWGEAGYMRLARNKHNMCGIATNALFPVI